MRDVADMLRQQILDSDYPVGSPLPTEAELMNEFQAPRAVVRGALDLLRQERLIERLRGLGTFSVSKKVSHRFERLQAVGAGHPRGDERMWGEVIALDVIQAANFLAEHLSLEPTQSCLRIEVLVSFDGVPYSLTTNYLSGSLAQAARTTPYNGDWWRYLRQMGCEPDVADVSVEAIAADAYVAPILDVDVGDPLMLITRLVRDNDGHPVNFAYARNRSDRLVLNMKVPIGDSSLHRTRAAAE